MIISLDEKKHLTKVNTHPFMKNSQKNRNRGELSQLNKGIILLYNERLNDITQRSGTRQRHLHS